MLGFVFFLYSLSPVLPFLDDGRSLILLRIGDGVTPPSIATQLYPVFIEEWSTTPQGYSGPNPWSLTLLNAPWALISTTAVDPSRCRVRGDAFYTNLQLSRSANNRYLTFGCADPSDVTDKRRTVVRVNWNTTLEYTVFTMPVASFPLTDVISVTGNEYWVTSAGVSFGTYYLTHGGSTPVAIRTSAGYSDMTVYKAPR